MHGEREGVCILKGSSVRALGEGGCVHGEREGVCICKGRVCVHGESEDVCIWKESSACMGEGVCAYGRGRVCIWKESSVRAWGEGGCVHMEGVKCSVFLV